MVTFSCHHEGGRYEGLTRVDLGGIWWRFGVERNETPSRFESCIDVLSPDDHRSFLTGVVKGYFLVL
jgi:hypothetical protein